MEHGTERRLARRLGPCQAGAFVVSSMIGAGIFTTPAVVRAQAGGGASFLVVWIAGAVLALAGALCYAELGARMPRAGGEYVYLHRAFGPAWAFLSGWTSLLVGFSAAMAAAALGAAAYLEALLASVNGVASSSTGPLAAIVLVLGVTGLHCSGIRLSGRVQGTMAAAVLAGLALLAGSAVWATGRPGLDAVAPAGARPLLALITVSFAYSGWNAAAYLAGEVRTPQRTLPRALVGGTVAVALAYLAFNAAALLVLTEGEWSSGLAVGHALAARAMGPSGGVVASGLVVLAIVGSISAMAATGPRVTLAMAEDGLAPGALARLSPHRVPVRATLLQGGLAGAFALTGTFEALLIYVGSALLVFSSAAVLAVIVIRRTAGPPRETFAVPAYPLPPLVFLLGSTGALGAGLVQAPVPSLAGLATVAAGMLAYRLRSRSYRRFDAIVN